MTCTCNKQLKISEKSGKTLKTCGDLICQNNLRNKNMLEKLGDISSIDKQFIDDKLIKNNQLNRNLIRLIPYTIQDLFNIYYSIENPKCECGENRKFASFKEGYIQTCGDGRCYNNLKSKKLKEKTTKLVKYGDENYNNNAQTQITNMKKLGVNSNLNSKEQLIKTHLIKLEKGIHKSEEFKTDYQKYKRLVLTYTNNSPIKTLRNFDKRGLNNYHLDHKFSISEGFKQNILPSYIGSIHNLEMIESTLNRKKATECSITKKELLV